MRAQVTLISGAQIEFDIDSLEIETIFTGEKVQKLLTKQPVVWSRNLRFINVDEISAIVVIYDAP